MQVQSQPICICFKIKFYEDWVFCADYRNQNCLDKSLLRNQSVEFDITLMPNAYSNIIY